MGELIKSIMYFVPVYAEETIAIRRMPDGRYQTLCNAFAIDTDQEKFDGIIRMRFISWMGVAYFVKQISNVVYCTSTKRPVK